jgi:zinc and cadmium transporter
MGTLGYILGASVAGGLLSVAAAAAISFATRPQWVSVLISFAIGALLGASFLEVLPHALGNAENLQAVSATVLGGILAFFVLEKLVLWRHFHGDAFHNFVDGVMIAAAFMESPALGAVTATAVIAHEIPQEVGDFLILLHSGYTKARAFALNLLSSVAMVVGALGAYLALQAVAGWINTLLALAAASMIYVAVADLIPSLHRRPALGATAQQALLIGLGVATIWLIGRLAHGT